VNGVKCLSFDEVLCLKDSTIVIVANMQPDEIVRQLIEFHFPFISTDDHIYGFFMINS